MRTGVTARTTWGVAVLACLGVLPLAGCGGADDANAAASQDPVSRALQSVYPSSGSGASKSSPSPSASRGASLADPFVVPEKAKAYTREGAVEFVKFYNGVLAELNGRPQTGVIKRLATPSCQSCQKQEDFMRQLVRENLHVNVSEQQHTQFTVDPKSTSDIVVVQYESSDRGAQHIDRRGKVVKALPPLRMSMAVRLTWSNGGWKIDEVGGDEHK